MNDTINPAETNPTKTKIAQAHLDHPRTRAAFHTTKLLVGGYLGLSLATLAAVVLLRHHPSIVTDAVWIRGTIVVASAIVTFLFTVHAARGSRGAYKRLRVVSIAMTGAITVIIAVPGAFPLWMKIEQGVCGLLLIGVVAVTNGRHLRSVFARG